MFTVKDWVELLKYISVMNYMGIGHFHLPIILKINCIQCKKLQSDSMSNENFILINLSLFILSKGNPSIAERMVQKTKTETEQCMNQLEEQKIG